jgi:uncharacterized protein (TIGR02145 family)
VNIKFLILITLTVLCLLFTRCKTDSVKDIDENVYPTIKIGNQIWMAENLKTTRYSNGDTINTTIPPTREIELESLPKYHWTYDGDENNVAKYGRLYTWFVAADERNVCPTGWHVPTDAEWTALTEYLANTGNGFGGGYRGMDIAKSMSAKSGWVPDETPGSPGNDHSSNNSSGFNAVSAGCRLEDGNFHKLGHYANWWTSTEGGTAFMQILTGEVVKVPGGLVRVIYHDYNYVNSYVNNKKYGISIRCLKDI